jgi:pyrroline-5-carboxylate reductase
MEERIGFIGVGAMGSALLKGLIEGGVQPNRIVAADAVADRLQELANRFGIKIADGNQAVAEKARVVFLAVKPQDVSTVLHSIDPLITKEHLIVSVAAGVPIAFITNLLSQKCGVIRVMPNTPCLVGAGAMALARGRSVSDGDLEMVKRWLERVGLVREVPEKLLDAVTGLSGSGPAYVYLIIEALADGGVLAGLPRELARDLAVQTVYGSARMVMETGEHPALLREMVTSPGGTTAAGLFQLEAGGVRAAVASAVRAAAERAKELGS